MSNGRVPLARFIPREELAALSVQRIQFGTMDEVPLIELEPLDGMLGSVLDAVRKPEPEPEPEEAHEVPEVVPLEALQTLQEQMQAQAQAHAQELADVQAAHAAELEQARAQAHEEGRAEGHAAASAEWQQRLEAHIAGEGRATAERLESVAKTFGAQLDGLEKGLAQEVLRLSCAIAEQVVRRELTSPARVLEAVVREAVELVIADRKPITVRLHPHDHEKLASELAQRFPQEADIQWLPDAQIESGGCMVESGGALIDGTVGARWERAVAALGLEVPWQPGDDGDGI